MLDLKFVRENPDIVKQNIKNKFQDEKLPLVDWWWSAGSAFFLPGHVDHEGGVRGVRCRDCA